MSAHGVADIIALSSLQKGLYSLSMTTTGVDPYVVAWSIRLQGAVDPTRLRQAYDRLVDRHPHLRGLVWARGSGEPVLIIPAAGTGEWSTCDYRRLDHAHTTPSAQGAQFADMAVAGTSAEQPDPEAIAAQMLEKLWLRRFDLEQGPLIRAQLVQIADDDYLLLMTAHHIAVDGWSIPILFADFVTELSGVGWVDGAPKLRDYAAWRLSRDTAVAAEAWEQYLRNAEPMPRLAPPIESAALPVAGEANAGEEGSRAIHRLARSLGATVATVLQVAWARVLSSLTARDDVIFQQTSSGRDAPVPGIEKMVGALITTTPVRINTAGGDVKEVIMHAQRDALAMQPHHHLGLEGVIAAAGQPAQSDSLFVFQNAPRGTVAQTRTLPGGIAIQPLSMGSFTHYPMAVVPWLDEGIVHVSVEVRADLIDDIDPTAMAQRIVDTACRMADPYALDLPLSSIPCTTAEEERIFGARADGGADDKLHGARVDTQWADVCARYPQRIAVIDREHSISYAQAEQFVNTLADSVRALGMAGKAIGVMLPRDFRVILAPFALARAGAVCVHIDPHTPADRLVSILRQSGAVAVLGENTPPCPVPVLQIGYDGTISNRSLADTRQEFIPDTLAADDPAFHPDALYAIFTSGTTGEPKGAVCTHRGLLNLWQHHDRNIHQPTAARLGRPVRIGHLWSTGFDAAWQPTIGLLGGHTIVLCDDDTRRDPDAIVAAIDEHGIDVMETSPTMFHRLHAAGLVTGTDAQTSECPLAVLGLGGESIAADTWTLLSALKGTEVYNFYGPTEATVDALSAPLSASNHPVIGRPLDGTSAAIVDHRNRPTPPGGKGELVVYGPQIFAGYIGRKDLTEKRRIVDDNGVAGYRTGDIASIDAHGMVRLWGRADRQLKIHGNRIEPDEVAAVLRELPGVEDAAVCGIEEGTQTRLAAVVVGDVEITHVRRQLLSRLPRYMVPTRWAHLDQVPRTRNDKVDEQAIARHVEKAHARSAQHTEHERIDADPVLAEIYSIVSAQLPQQRIDVDEDFLGLGLDSIALIAIISALRGRGYAVSTRTVFEARTLSDLATLLAPTNDSTAQLGASEGAHDQLGTPETWSLSALAKETIALGSYEKMCQIQVLAIPADTTAEDINDILHNLVRAHPILTSTLVQEDGTPVLRRSKTDQPRNWLLGVERSTIIDAARLATDQLDPHTGGMLVATRVNNAEGNYLVLCISHLVVDAVSWQFILANCARGAAGEPMIASDTHAMPRSGTTSTALPPTYGRASQCRRINLDLDPNLTAELIATSSVETILVSALSEVAEHAGFGTIVATERHGRDATSAEAVGWFTQEIHQQPTIGGLENTDSRGRVRMNYLGRIDALTGMLDQEDKWAVVLDRALIADIAALCPGDAPMRFAIDIQAAIHAPAPGQPPQLAASIDIAPDTQLDHHQATALAKRWLDTVAARVQRTNTAHEHH
ncbi:MAG: AMP-binding protein [Corynebacterium sp.]|uniref:AMP-binding protein n=1 Tax=Corynebacterium sp. TaxID=1720 RepID=UPI0026DD41D3|nr:AMP-binding protein [Corynebacterium sp.]MDO4760460.1 AMP-binding protein [Corynebacterium sp.]